MSASFSTGAVSAHTAESLDAKMTGPLCCCKKSVISSSGIVVETQLNNSPLCQYQTKYLHE